MVSSVALLASVVIQATGERVAPLPRPTGRHAVGTTVAYLTDATRPDPDFPTGRPITLQVWYPAAGASGDSSPYLVEPGLREALGRFQYYGVDSVALDRWAALPTHSVVDAAPVQGRHPLLAFSVGLGVIRANYTSIAEELASHGFVVAMVESPLQGLMARPDGPVVADTAGKYGEPVTHRTAVSLWARDISFGLDQLLGGGATKAVARAGSLVDTSRIGALGHSTGGLVAIAACEADQRIRACANLDGGLASPDQQPLADFVPRGVARPTLFLRSQPLYDDTTLARRGMTREQWIKRGEAGRLALDAFVQRSSGSVLRARIAGTGHFSFSDAPYVMPSAISRFGGRIIPADRGWGVVTATIRAFFDQALTRQDGALAALAARTPELTLDSAGR